MILKNKWLSFVLFIMTVFSASTYAQSVTTASGYADGYVLRATQQGNMIKVDIRFEAQVDGYSGETIYQSPSSTSWQQDFYVEINGKRYPLSIDSEGKYQAPESLKLTFCYNTQKNPRVGSWRGIFTGPNSAVDTINVALPNLPLIQNVPVSQIH